MIEGTVRRGNNNYYFVEGGEIKNPDEFGIKYDRSEYFRNLVDQIEIEGTLRGYDFVITIRDLHIIPINGPLTIVIIIGEERFLVPKYASDVLAVFRCMGPHYREAFPLRKDYVGLLIGLRELRRHLLTLSANLKSILSRLILGRRSAPFYVIPLGYASKVEQTPPAIGSRPYDVSFIGSKNPYLENSRSFRDLVGTPKSVSRQRMLESLSRYSQSHPERNVHVRLTGDFGESMKAGPDHFAEILNKSKICLAPRGGSVETTRLYQGIICGCVVISEPLPPYSFYEDAPIVCIKHWNKLGTVLDDLLNCPERLEQLSARGREWWETRCSETVVARFIAERVLAVRRAKCHDLDASPPKGEESALKT
jgi:hypothetical protein